MNATSNIQTQLEVANERVFQLEQAVRDYPGLPSIAANLDSAIRIQKKLRDQLDAANQEQNGH